MLKKSVLILVALLVLAGLPVSVFAEDHGKPPVEELEQQFDDLISQELGQDYELLNYESLEALESDIKEVMVDPLADYYMDRFFFEENGNVYLWAQDSPTKIKFDEEYRLEKISETKYELIQESADDLRGTYNFTITYIFENGKWIFEDRKRVVRYSDTGGELPDTATSTPAAILFGFLLFGAGAIFALREKYADHR